MQKGSIFPSTLRARLTDARTPFPVIRRSSRLDGDNGMAVAVVHRCRSSVGGGRHRSAGLRLQDFGAKMFENDGEGARVSCGIFDVMALVR